MSQPKHQHEIQNPTQARPRWEIYFRPDLCCRWRFDGTVSVDRHLDMSSHIPVQLHGDVELADRLEWLFEGDLSTIDRKTFLLKLLRDVARGNRPEKMVIIPNPSARS